MTTVIAHRGARSLAPENTLVAARIACSMGAHLWETDVNITQDGRLILFHDQTLDRCTDVAVKFAGRPSFAVKDFTLKEILSLDAGSFFIETDPFFQIAMGKVSSHLLAAYKNEKIPTLEQGLALVKELDWAVNLELKSFSFNQNDCFLVDKTLDVIRESCIFFDRVKISSFNHDWLHHVQKKEPGVDVQALLGDDLETDLDFGDFIFDTYNVNAHMVTPGLIQTLKSKGKKINLFTINDPDEFTRFTNLGVDGIFTDFPQLFCGQ